MSTFTKKLMSSFKRKAKPETAEDIVEAKLLNLYVSYFMECGYPYNDAIESEALNLASDTTADVKEQLKKVDRIMADSKSKVNVYTKALGKVVKGKMDIDEFLKRKEGLNLYE